jgi:hypothetical protein
MGGIPMMRTENRKLPAWIGSILIHAILLLFVLYWFSSGPDRSMPGERNAVGSIVLQSRGGAREPGAASPSAHTAESELTEFEKFAQGTLSLPIPAPGRQQGTQANAGSAAEITQSFETTGSGNAGKGMLGTGETVVQIFGTQGKGTRFMYVFDHSASMEGRLIRRAKAELVQSLDSLGDLHQFNIIFYNNESKPWRSGTVRKLIYATQSDKLDATRFIDGITAIGGTKHVTPLLEAIAHRPDVIFFLTDGESKDDLKPAELEAIERANSFGRGAQINVIQFGYGGLTDSESRSLRQLAEQNHGGQYRYINVTEWW